MGFNTSGRRSKPKIAQQFGVYFQHRLCSMKPSNFAHEHLKYWRKLTICIAHYSHLMPYVDCYECLKIYNLISTHMDVAAFEC